MAKLALIRHPRRPVSVLAAEAGVALAARHRLGKTPAIVKRDGGKDDAEGRLPKSCPKASVEPPGGEWRNGQNSAAQDMKTCVKLLLRQQEAHADEPHRAADEKQGDPDGP